MSTTFISFSGFSNGKNLTPPTLLALDSIESFTIAEDCSYVNSKSGRSAMIPQTEVGEIVAGLEHIRHYFNDEPVVAWDAMVKQALALRARAAERQEEEELLRRARELAATTDPVKLEGFTAEELEELRGE